jgi:hypothetical protein
MVTISYGYGTNGKLYDFHDGFLFFGSSTYTSTTAVGNKTTTYCSTFNGVGDDLYNGCYIKCLSATNADNEGEIREITDFEDDAPHAFFTHDAFTANTTTGDTFLLSAWKIVEDGQTLSTPTVVAGDYMRLTASASAGNETGYITNFSNLGLSTTLATKIRFRYRTSSINVKAKIICTDDAAYSDEVLSDDSSTSWKVGTFDLTTAKTLDHIRLYADHSTGYVDYDFALVYEGDFTFPNSIRVEPEYPINNEGVTMPSRQGKGPQYMGDDGIACDLTCDLTRGTWIRTGDTVVGDVFRDIWHNSNKEPWQWLDLTSTQLLDAERLKVQMRSLRFPRYATGTALHHEAIVRFREYRLSHAGTEETWQSRLGTTL